MKTNEQKISTVPYMNTIIGVDTFQHDGVNSIENFGDNSRFEDGVNTMSKIGVNTNSTYGDSTSNISCYKAHKAKRTYAKRKERSGVHTSSSSDNRYSKVGPCDVKSRIRLVLVHHPNVKRRY